MSAITYYEVIQYHPATLSAKGLVIAVFDSNATKSLEQLNGKIIAGTHNESPTDPEGATTTLWRWEGGLANTNTSSIMGGRSSSMNNTDVSSNQPPQTSSSMP